MGIKMCKKTVSAALLLLCQQSFAQPDLNQRIELGGSLSYSYSSLTSYGATLKMSNLEIQPSLGIFVSSTVEIIVGPEYSVSSAENSIGLASPSTITSSELGILSGVGYHFPVDERFVPYVSATGRLYWNRMTYSPSIIPSAWSRPTIVFPSFEGGVKAFISKDWALVMKMGYSLTPQLYGNTENHSYMISIGTGFAIFL